MVTRERSLLTRRAPWPQRLITIGLTFVVFGFLWPLVLGWGDSARGDEAGDASLPLIGTGVVVVLIGVAGMLVRRGHARQE